MIGGCLSFSACHLGLMLAMFIHFRDLGANALLEVN